MFVFICDGLTLSIIFTCLLGISLTFEYFLPKIRYSLLFCAIPLSFLVPFFIEHFFGLGRPIWLFIPATAVSLYLIRRRGWSLAKETVLWYFLISFMYSFWFRFQSPEMVCYIEKIADHTFLIDCSRGEQLPPEDVWMKGAHVDMYYYFQYYVAAWLGRGMPLGTGASCNIGFGLAIGFSCAAIGVVVRELSSSVIAGCLGVFQVLFGANGTSILVIFMTHKYSYWDPAQFNNTYDNPQLLERDDVTNFGRWFFHTFSFAPTYLPMEQVAQTIVLGDYHPTLSGIYLLGMALLVICLAEKEGHGTPTDRACLMIGCFLPALAIVSNTWILPLNGLILVLWLAYRWWSGKGDSLREIICYGGGSLLIIFPFLIHFVAGEQNYHLAFDLSYVDISLFSWLILFYPVVFMLVIGAWPTLNLLSRCLIFIVALPFGIYQMSGLPSYILVDAFPLVVLCLMFVFRGFARSEYRFFLFCAIFLLVFTRFVHVDDYLGAEDNTVRKWWFWAFTFGSTIGLGAAWKGRITRVLAIGMVLLTTIPFLIIIGPDPYTILSRSAGRLDGSTFLRQEQAYNAIIDYLNTLPRGVLVEGAADNDQGGCPLFQQFTPHYSYGGWIDNHEKLWRGNRYDLDRMVSEKMLFYQGKSDDPKRWLLSQGIDYVLWRYSDDERDDNNGPKIWAVLNEKLAPDYTWRDFSNPDTPPDQQKPVGVLGPANRSSVRIIVYQWSVYRKPLLQ